MYLESFFRLVPSTPCSGIPENCEQQRDAEATVCGRRASGGDRGPSDHVQHLAGCAGHSQRDRRRGRSRARALHGAQAARDHEVRSSSMFCLANRTLCPIARYILNFRDWAPHIGVCATAKVGMHCNSVLSWHNSCHGVYPLRSQSAE